MQRNLPARDLAESIVQRLKESGFEALLVGGCVRDLILGRAPKDFDVATSATPVQILNLYPRAGVVGAHFGVVLVTAGGVSVEVATFRSDGAYADGRHPESVRFEKDARRDAERRDFTINALFLNSATGEVIDYTGGRSDLEHRFIRAIGDPRRRFQEDYLRMLRAIRFAARFGFDIEPGTFAAIREMAPLVTYVAAERVREEINRILIEGGARQGFELLDSTGLLAYILPEVSAMKGVEQPPEYHPEGDVWRHTLLMLGEMREPELTLALGILLHDVGKPDTFRIADRIRFDGHVEKGVEIARSILGRLRYSSDVSSQVEALIANHMKFKDVPHMRESTLKRFLRMTEFEQHMELHRIDCLSSNGNLGSYNFIREKQAETPAESLKPAPLVTGRDLIHAGYKPGPMFGVVLLEIEDAQLEGRLTTPEAALAFARQRLPQVHRTNPA